MPASGYRSDLEHRSRAPISFPKPGLQAPQRRPSPGSVGVHSRSDPMSGQHTSAAGPPQGARPLGERREAPLGGDHTHAASVGIEVRDLAVVYGRFVAVADMSFRVDPGESFGIVGESGSGEDDGAARDLRACAARRRNRRARRRSVAARGVAGAGYEAFPPSRADGFPGSVRIAASKADGRPDSRRAARDPWRCRRRSSHRARTRRSRSGIGIPVPLSAPALRRPAAADRDRTGVDPRAADPSPRRAHLVARRVGAGRGR